MSIMGPCSRGKVAALLTYILCEWFSDNFVVNFVVTTILIACDFWTVCLCLSLYHSTHKHQLGSPRHEPEPEPEPEPELEPNVHLDYYSTGEKRQW